MKKFWNWIRDENEGRVLRLEGPIDEESFWGDEVTPKAFRADLESEEGDITVWINSPGGNVFAAAEIYTMLKEYKGEVTVKIASIAASAASVVAMAGSKVLMSPTALLMVHDPSTIAFGNTKDMEKAIATLNEVKESIINAYAAKSGLSHSRISKLMSDETWINAKKAVELGFADEVLFENKDEEKPDEKPETEEPEEGEGNEGGSEEEEKKPFQLHAYMPTSQIYSSRQMDLAILNQLGVKAEKELVVPVHQPWEMKFDEKPVQPVIGLDGTTEDGSVPFAILEKQLEFLK